MKIEFDKKKKKWINLPQNSKKGIYIDSKLYKKLQNVKAIQKKGYDCVILIDGGRREGKSIMAMTCAWILSDCKLTLNNFAIGSEDAKKKINELPDRSILFVDEGSAIFSSKDAMKKELKELVKILDVVGMKEIIFIIVLPSFFDLVRPIATRFSRFLLHIYTDDKMNRGRFAYFGTKEKRMLYTLGKKNFDSYRKPNANFIGRFIDFRVPFYDEYLKLKKKTLLHILKSSPETTSNTHRINVLKELVKNNEKNKNKLTQKQLGHLFMTTERTIQRYVKGIKENDEN